VIRPFAAAVVFAAFLVPTASPAASLGVRFTWAGTAACSTVPPAFTISGVPKGSRYLVFNLVDLDKPDYVHGGGQIPYSGSAAVPAGAFGGSYRGPCPPPGVVHTYRWTVEAMDANSNALAKGIATGTFPPK
jgi:phosphatidylethanolamine-binding protein (PEBP) family uncharacterized protein